MICPHNTLTKIRLTQALSQQERRGITWCDKLTDVTYE